MLSPRAAHSRSSGANRDYSPVFADGAVSSVQSRERRMQEAVDLLWAHLSSTDVSWIGFYLKAPGQDELVLGPRRDKPACSPIELHGACGQCLTTMRPLVITDVDKLGAGYIACDPRDKAEVVIPLFESDGTCWGVLDLDSHTPGAFTEHDARELTRLVQFMELSLSAPPSADDIRVI